MVQQYLLPCECGRANPVTVAQAGGTVVCGCGREHAVPKLAVLRQLEPVAAPVSKAPQAWSSLRGMLFVGGVLLALIGLLAGTRGTMIVRKIDLEKIDKHFAEIEHNQLEEIDQMTPIQAYEVWEKIRVMGPGLPGSAETAQFRQIHTLYLRVAIIGFTAAAVGILMAAGSLIRAPARN